MTVRPRCHAVAVGWIRVFVGAVAQLTTMACHSDERLWNHLVEMNPPEPLYRLEVSDSRGQILWVLESVSRETLAFVDYGDVPFGFVQLHPAQVPPEPLAREQRYFLTYAMPEERWVRISTRPGTFPTFFHGITFGGQGCDSPGCDEVFLWKQWTRRPEPRGAPKSPSPQPGMAESLTFRSSGRKGFATRRRRREQEAAGPAA
jgi:hypothetical protein